MDSGLVQETQKRCFDRPVWRGQITNGYYRFGSTEARRVKTGQILGG